MKSLASILFKDYRQKVLGLLLLHPESEYHVREIARLTNTVAGTLHKELKLLADVGILSKQKIGNQVLYKANINCSIFKELASILRKTSGVVDVIKSALSSLTNNIEVAFVFGSVAKGIENEGSDIDVMVIGDVAFFDVVKSLHSSQEILGREINPKVYILDEWKKEVSNNSIFLKEVMEQTKLYIIGDENDLKKFSR